MTTHLHSTVSDEQRRQWANSDTVERAEFDGKVYEYNDDGRVYVLKRSSPAPTRAGQTGHLDLIQIIDEPDAFLGQKIHDLNEL